MGGHAAGEVASKITVDTVGEFIAATRQKEEATWPFKYNHELHFNSNRLAVAIEKANERVMAAVAAQPWLKGMGTTVVAGLLNGRFSRSRTSATAALILYRDGQLSRLTDDHSWVHEQVAAGILTEEEAKSHPLKNVVTARSGRRSLRFAGPAGAEFRARRRFPLLLRRPDDDALRRGDPRRGGGRRRPPDSLQRTWSRSPTKRAAWTTSRLSSRASRTVRPANPPRPPSRDAAARKRRELPNRFRRDQNANAGISSSVRTLTGTALGDYSQTLMRRATVHPFLRNTLIGGALCLATASVVRAGGFGDSGSGAGTGTPRLIEALVRQRRSWAAAWCSSTSRMIPLCEAAVSRRAADASPSSSRRSRAGGRPPAEGDPLRALRRRDALRTGPAASLRAVSTGDVSSPPRSSSTRRE